MPRYPKDKDGNLVLSDKPENVLRRRMNAERKARAEESVAKNRAEPSLPDPNKSSELFYRALQEKFIQDGSNPQVREINLADVAFLPLRSLSVALKLEKRRSGLQGWVRVYHDHNVLLLARQW